MTQDKMDALQRELERVAKKHGLINCAFCGTEKETGGFIGLVVDTKTTIHTLWDTVLNVGRHWQHMRSLTRDNLNKFEKKGW